MLSAGALWKKKEEMRDKEKCRRNTVSAKSSFQEMRFHALRNQKNIVNTYATCKLKHSNS